MEQVDRINEALFRQLISNSSIPLIGSAIGSLLVAISQTESSDSEKIISWLCLVYATLAVRIWLTRRCKNQLASTGYEADAARRHALTIGLSGLAWGAGGLLIIDSTPIALVITTTAIQAMVMGGVLTLGTFVPAFLAFAIPAILPMILVFVYLGGTANFVLALYSSIFLALMIGIAFRYNKSLSNAWQITFEKEDLIKSLTEANEKISLQNNELAHIAHHDMLTGLPNRQMLADRMSQAMTRSQRNHSQVAVLFLDLDGFKPINDEFGHEAGDVALQDVTQRLSGAMRREDTLARVGGDEFVILLSDLNENTKDAVELVANKCLSVFQQPFLINDQPRRIGTSIGIAIGDGECSPDKLLIAADLAMYRAKEAGRKQFFWANECLSCSHGDKTSCSIHK
ncbi:MAG: GGDEF domain-containing protein [Gallionellaceae bacterium]|jgi:diguanylate cyclase (GGDEF)-like protein